MREGDFPIFTPALFRLISGRFLFTGMRDSGDYCRVKKGRGVVTVDMEPYEARAGRPWWSFPDSFMASVSAALEAMEYENIIFLPSMLMSAESDLCTYDFCVP